METGKETLPGLEVSVSGNVVESNSTRLFTYNPAGINGCECSVTLHDHFAFRIEARRRCRPKR